MFLFGDIIQPVVEVFPSCMSQVSLAHLKGEGPASASIISHYEVSWSENFHAQLR